MLLPCMINIGLQRAPWHQLHLTKRCSNSAGWGRAVDPRIHPWGTARQQALCWHFANPADHGNWPSTQAQGACHADMEWVCCLCWGLRAAAQLRRLPCGASLLVEALRDPVIRALELERRCRKWCAATHARRCCTERASMCFSLQGEVKCYPGALRKAYVITCCIPSSIALHGVQLLAA